MLFENIRPFPIQLTDANGQVLVLMPGQTFDFPESFGKSLINVLKPVGSSDLSIDDLVSEFVYASDIVENNSSEDLFNEPQTTDLEELSSIIEIVPDKSVPAKKGKGRPKTSDAANRAEYKRELRKKNKVIKETKQFLLNEG